jgi:hypothetical protein
MNDEAEITPKERTPPEVVRRRHPARHGPLEVSRQEA